MNSVKNLEKMIQLTEKKIQALSYLLELLKADQINKNKDFLKTYVDKKFKVEKAILKVDIEFLTHYNVLLESQGVTSIYELKKEDFRGLHKLKLTVSEAEAISVAIKKAEKNLFEKNIHLKSMSNEKVLNATAPSAIKAYKKLNK